MGLWISTPYFVVPDGVELDWQAAWRVIEHIECREVYGAAFYNWEAVPGADNWELGLGADNWEPVRKDADEPPDPLGVYEVVSEARVRLEEDLSTMIDAVEARPADPQLAVARMPGFRVYTTGGLSTPDGAPSLLHDPMLRLAGIGALHAAGAVDADTTAGVPADRRRDTYTATERRWAASGRAALRAADEARRLQEREPALKDLTAADRLSRIRTHAVRAERAAARVPSAPASGDLRAPADPAARELLAELTAVAAEATAWAGDVAGGRDPWIIGREIAEVLSDAQPRRERRAGAPSRHAAEVLDAVEDLEFFADCLDGTGDPDDCAREARGAGSLAKAAYGWIVGVALVACARALAALAPGGLRDALPIHEPLTDFGPAGPVTCDLDPYDGPLQLSFLAFPKGTRPRWAAARAAANAAGLTDEFELLEAVPPLQGYRYSDPIPVPEGQLWAIGDWHGKVRALHDAGIIRVLGGLDPTAAGAPGDLTPVSWRADRRPAR